MYNIERVKIKEEWADRSGCEPNWVLDSEISKREIVKALRTMKSNKSPGLHGIPVDFFKMFQANFTDPLYTLFNQVMILEEVPSHWAHAIIVPLYKGKGRKSDPNNYRGVALLNTVGIRFATIINNRLRKWCEERELLDPAQAGFKANSST